MSNCSRRAASHCCPFWQPSCAFRWSAPDGPKRPLGRPLRMMGAKGARCPQTAGRCSQNHATLTWLVYSRLVATGRPLGRPLRTRPRAVDYLLSPGCDFVGDVLGRRPVVGIPYDAVRKTMLHGPVWCMVNYSRRAASHCCPFWQPSCAFRWSAPDGPKRPLGLPLRWPRSGQFFTSRGYPEAMSLL